MATPSLTRSAACFRFCGVIRFSVPFSSSLPQRPQFDSSTFHRSMSACVTVWFDPPPCNEGAVPIAAMIATMMTVAATVLLGYLLSEREQGPKLADVLQFLQRLHALDERFGPLAAEHRLHQAPRLRRDGRRVQWILLRARGMPRELAHRSPVAERHLHQAAAGRRRVHQRAIRDELHALLCGAHLRIH